nr:MAG TPA: virion morphogenesis protein [Caudoviricetes sp.]DAY64094.1 MAG TPA: virion morphogenesis protein [Caudoviricetes sp.]
MKLPARPFIGASRELENEVTRLVRKELDRVFKQ